jgi:lysozyme
MAEPTLAAADAARQPLRRRGRWVFVVVGTVALLAGLAAAWWFLWVPNWRPPLREGERYGVDVSAYQGTIDWTRIAGDNISFAYVKATEGGDFTDDRFGQNWRGAGDAGLDQGAYHFFTLCTPGAEQARHFLDVVPPDPDALAPAVDLELVGNCSSRPSGAEVREQLDAFLGPVEEAWGRQVVLYVGDDFEAAYPFRDRLARPLWLRRFLLRPDDGAWTVWQLHGHAHVDGIEGGVDLDVMRPAS